MAAPLCARPSDDFGVQQPGPRAKGGAVPKSIDRAGLRPLCLARPARRGGPGLATGSLRLASRLSLTLPEPFVPAAWFCRTPAVAPGVWRAACARPRALRQQPPGELSHAWPQRPAGGVKRVQCEGAGKLGPGVVRTLLCAPAPWLIWLRSLPLERSLAGPERAVCRAPAPPSAPSSWGAILGTPAQCTVLLGRQQCALAESGCCSHGVCLVCENSRSCTIVKCTVSVNSINFNKKTVHHRIKSNNFFQTLFSLANLSPLFTRRCPGGSGYGGKHVIAAGYW